MKDYSFGDLEYQRRFILNYGFTDDNKIIIYLASGELKYLDNNKENIYRVIATMKMQINRAYDDLHNSTINYRFIKTYLTFKGLSKDIEKNKIFLDNLAYINNALLAQSSNWILQLPSSIKNYLMKKNSPLDLNDADNFSLKGIVKILDSINNNHVKFKKR